MNYYVLDTNIVSAILKRQVPVMRELQNISLTDHMLIGCPVVWYETRRGLQAKRANKQLERLQDLFGRFDWQDYTRDDWTLAATWWARLRTNGVQIADADLLIAVFTHRRNATLVTDNTKDFSQLDVTTVNWLV